MIYKYNYANNAEIPQPYLFNILKHNTSISYDVLRDSSLLMNLVIFF